MEVLAIGRKKDAKVWVTSVNISRNNDKKRNSALKDLILLSQYTCIAQKSKQQEIDEPKVLFKKLTTIKECLD